MPSPSDRRCISLSPAVGLNIRGENRAANHSEIASKFQPGLIFVYHPNPTVTCPDNKPLTHLIQWTFPPEYVEPERRADFELLTTCAFLISPSGSSVWLISPRGFEPLTFGSGGRNFTYKCLLPFVLWPVYSNKLRFDWNQMPVTLQSETNGSETCLFGKPV